VGIRSQPDDVSPPLGDGAAAGPRHGLTRRQATLGLGALAGSPLALGWSSTAWAQRPPQGGDSEGLRGTQREGTIAPIPIAIPEFLGEDRRFSAETTNVVVADLERCGLFQPLDPASFIDRIRDFNTPPRFQDWRVIGAQALVVGRCGKFSDGRYGVEFRVFDVLGQRELVGKRFSADPNEWRRLAHKVADQAYERLTGERGYFDTQIAFIDETGPKDRRRKRLAIMDQDAANVRLLSKGDELVLTPRFSPTAQEITYLQYTGEQPRVFLMNMETGRREVMGNFPGMTFAPRFSPDGQRLVMSIGEGGASSLAEMDLRTRQTRRLTNPGAIDTAPCYSPDGRRIVFETDRDGAQQLHVMEAGGSGSRRISHGDGRYATPVWSPRGDLIAFTKQAGGGFLIGVMRPDGSGERILTEGYHNEGPTWSPNGRVILFFRESQGANGGAKLFSIDLTGYNERPVQTPSFGSDPAWGPLRA
jgi:TolB protein